MNADAVQAAEGALLASWKVANDSFSRGMATHAAARDAATAVAAAEPILRAAIAAEIERKSHEARNEYERGLFRYGSAVEPGSRDPWAEGAIDAYLDAARIARGES